MKLGIPQILIIVLYTLGVGISLAKHGEMEESKKHNVVPTLIGTAIQVALLWWGGFFG